LAINRVPKGDEMEKFGKNEESRVSEEPATSSYEEPVIKDYGSIEEMTAGAGTSFHDVPVGAASVGAYHGSTP
jgi:hypothetical protein